MAISEGMVSLLTGEASITTLLNSATSVYIDAIEQNHAMSYISVSVLHTDAMLTLGTTSSMRKTEFDIDCVCSSRVKSNTLAAAVDTFIKDYTGSAGSHTINAVMLNDITHDAVALGQGTDNYKYITTLNLEVQHDG